MLFDDATTLARYNCQHSQSIPFGSAFTRLLVDLTANRAAARMSAVPGTSRPSSTTPLLASPRPRSAQPRDLSAVRYHTLPSLDRLPAKRRRTPHVQFVPFLLASAVFVFVCCIAWDVSTYGNCYFKPLCRILGDGSESMKEVWWINSGPYATWKSVGPGGGRTGLPRGCEIDQVNVVSSYYWSRPV